MLPTGEEKDATRMNDYTSLLSFVCGQKTITIADPMDLKSGWISEQVRCHIKSVILLLFVRLLFKGIKFQLKHFFH